MTLLQEPAPAGDHRRSSPAPGAGRPPAEAAPRMLGYITTTSHKTIGVMYTVTSFIFFALAGVMAELMRAELARPGLQFLSNEQYNQLFTIHGTVMMFLFAPALAFGFANYIVPLQIGAPDVSFPRLNALAYWLYAFGGTMVVAGFLTPDGAADFGWFAYAPLNSSLYSPGAGADLWIFGLTLSGLGHHLRRGQPGHHDPDAARARHDHVPDADLLLEHADHRHPGAGRLPGVRGGRRWRWRPTDISAPTSSTRATAARSSGSICSGSSAIPRCTSSPCPSSGWSPRSYRSSAENRSFGYKGLVFATIGIGALSIAVWAHHMYATGAVLLPFFALLSFLIAVPTGVKFFNWIGTMWRGQLTFETPMLWAIFFLVTFLFGGLTGVLLASPPIDFHVTDSYFVVAHFHYVVFGSAVFGGYAGIYFWFPKMTGRMLDDRLGKLHAWTQLIGFHMTFLVQHWLGIKGMPRRVADYSATDGFTTLNTFSTIGAFLLGASQLVFFYNVIRSYRHGELANSRRPLGLRKFAGMGDVVSASTAQLCLASAHSLRTAGIRSALSGGHGQGGLPCLA